MWVSDQWSIRDLGSSNGTFVNGQRIEAGQAVPIAAGTQVGFGSDESQWEVVDIVAPSAVAENLASGELRCQIGAQLALPSEDAPQLVVYRDTRGRDVAETDDNITLIADGDVVTVGDQAWRIHLPVSIEGTATVDAGARLDAIKMRFAVSMDEEHVEITIIHRGQETTLEAREHGYVLLTLARARINDSALPAAEQGWLDRDRLLKMLGIDSNALNVAIYRARGQLAAAGVDGAAAVVDVRRGARRFGVDPDRIEVVAL
jgi:hypothetical protein